MASSTGSGSPSLQCHPIPPLPTLSDSSAQDRWILPSILSVSLYPRFLDTYKRSAIPLWAVTPLLGPTLWDISSLMSLWHLKFMVSTPLVLIFLVSPGQRGPHQHSLHNPPKFCRFQPANASPICPPRCTPTANCLPQAIIGPSPTDGHAACLPGPQAPKHSPAVPRRLPAGGTSERTNQVLHGFVPWPVPVCPHSHPALAPLLDPQRAQPVCTTSVGKQRYAGRLAPGSPNACLRKG